MKVALYIRVSTERQAKEGDSLDEQESELRKFCDYRNYHIYSCYIERGKSGGNTNRPEYQKLIKDIEKQKISAVIVKKIDRLSRSLMDFENLMNLMQQKNVEFISLKENFDTTTAMGKAMLRVALVFAQLEREQTSERLSDVMAYRATQGIYNGGLRPYGYSVINKELVPYKKEKQIVELIFDKFLENKSTTFTARSLNETGYRDHNNKLWDKKQIQRILQHHIYIGELKWNGKYHQGIHQQVIANTKFELVQKIFNSNRNIRANSKTNALLQRILVCGYCGSILSPSYTINRYKTRYFYYRCLGDDKAGKKSCKTKHINFKTIEPQLINALLSLSEEQKFKNLENRILKYNQKKETEIHNIEKHILKLQGNQELLIEKKDKYLDSLLSSKFLSKERELIGKKINELELAEKQNKSLVNKQQFEINQLEEEKIDTTEFKKALVTFRVEQETYTYEQLKEYIGKLIEEITYYTEKLVIKFVLIPWKEEFYTNGIYCHSP